MIPANITIQIARLRDGKTWRATAEATGHDLAVVTAPEPDIAAHGAVGILMARERWREIAARPWPYV